MLPANEISRYVYCKVQSMLIKFSTFSYSVLVYSPIRTFVRIEGERKLFSSF